MARNLPIIATSEYEETDFWGDTRTLHAWEIKLGDSVTDTGRGYDTAREALDHAIGVAEGRYA